ncbi:MAG: manganese efflux pump MntP family protein [Anaerovoracaceae bacterium]
MGLFEIVLVGLGLSMDAFAAAICRGLAVKKLTGKVILQIGIAFGTFQAMMPAAGFFLGRQFEESVKAVDHWAAFLLLTFIGSKMIWEAVGDSDNRSICESAADPCFRPLRLREILSLALATSIDALAAGISFAFLQVRILPAVSLIGMITFILSCTGVILGHRCGGRQKTKAGIAGGLILILMGLKTLVEHMGLPG